MTAAARVYTVPIGDIVAGLARDIEAVCAELLPGGRREGAEWVTPSAISPFGCTTSVHLRPPRQGVWAAWAAQEKGDALDLVAKIACAGDKAAAIRWAKAWLGLDTRAAEAATPTLRPRAVVAPARSDDDDATRRAAKRLWIEAEPRLAGTAAAHYLAGRGIDLTRLGRQPRALHFHPRLKHPSGSAWPALVAAITRDGRFVGAHRTWLTAEGKKAPVDNPKMTLGRYAGGLIPLWRGASGKALREAPAGDRIILSEGIEDGLSAALAAPEYRVAAAVSLANLGAIVLPPAIAEVLIATQNDPWWLETQARPHGALGGLDKAIRRFQGEGRIVRLIRPEGGGKDINDMVRGVA